jgi:predicted PurR-regulated permease PerM
MSSKKSKENPPVKSVPLTDAAKSEPPAAISINVGAADGKRRNIVNRAVLFVLVITVLCILIPMLKMFLTPLLLAFTFAALFFPFYKIILTFFRGNRGIASLSCCIIILLGIVVPMYFLGYLVIHQLLALYQTVEPTVQSIARGENSEFIARFEGNPILIRLTELGVNWQGTAIDILKTAGATIAKMVNKTSLGALEIILSMFVTLFIMFYLFMDGENIIKKFRRLLPLRPVYQDMIITRFLQVSRATVFGTVIFAVIQGLLGAIVLLIFGVKTWMVWGVVMTALAFIPMLGAGTILIPAAIIKMATGHIWQGIIILVLSIGVISMIDNTLRPSIVGRGARMHDLLIFFSTIGGLSMFGPVGVIMGPVIMAFFVSITEIYTMELDEHFGVGKTEKA